MLTPQGESQLMNDEAPGGQPVLKVYNDATGKTLSTSDGNPTIGFGRNLVGLGLSNAECVYLLRNDITRCENEVTNKEPLFPSWPAIWRDVVVMIHYNTGNVLAWPHMLAAIKAGGPSAAIAAEVRNSGPWKGKEHARYERFARAIETGHW